MNIKEYETKQYLEQVKSIQKRIESMDVEFNLYKKEMASLGATDYSSDKVQSSTINDLSSLIVKLEGFKERIIKEKERLIAIADDVTDTINRVTNNKLYLLLKYRYIDERTWRQIAILVLNDATKENYVSRRLHRQALWEVDKVRKLKKVAVCPKSTD